MVCDPAVLAKVKPALQDLIVNGVTLEADLNRKDHLLMLERNELFWKGQHYAFRELVNGEVRYSSTTGNLMSGGGSGVGGAYNHSLNYYRGDGLKLVGILGLMPNVRIVADSLTDESQKAVAAMGEKILEKFWWQWNLEMVMPEIVKCLWSNGPAFLYTPYVANKELYGETAIPQFGEDIMSQVLPARFGCSFCGEDTSEDEAIQTGLVCPHCDRPYGPQDFQEAVHVPVPNQIGEQRFANGSVEFHLCSNYTVITPYHIKKLDDATWLMRKYEAPAGSLMRLYESLRGKRHASSSYFSGYDADAMRLRRQASSVSGRDSSLWAGNYWSVTQAWLEPDEFELMQPESRDMMLAKYPKGVQSIMVNDEVVDLIPESFKEVWAGIKPTVGEYFYAQPLGEDHAAACRLINDQYNVMVQTADKGIPRHFYNTNLIDPTVFAKRNARTIEWFPMAGSGLAEKPFYSTDPAQLSPVSVEVAATALQAARENATIIAPLWGGEKIERQTLGEAEMKRNQALMPHNTTWNFCRHGIARSIENGIRQAVKHSAGRELHFKRENAPAEALDLGDTSPITRGGWHAEVDEAIPMTWGQRRSVYFQLWQYGPQMLEAVGYSNPENLQTMNDAVGLKDIKIPGLAQRRKAREMIERLSAQEPNVMPPMAPGMPPDIQPSIPADEFEDDHMLSAQVVREWAQEEEAIALRDSNPMGYLNVIAWGKAHAAMAAPPMPPGELPPGEESPGGMAPPPDAAMASSEVLSGERPQSASQVRPGEAPYNQEAPDMTGQAVPI